LYLYKMEPIFFKQVSYLRGSHVRGAKVVASV
jgi:hypothetical protein